ncbi:MAG: hypothetical protein J6P03_07955 [Opitutales bacterium]|nr:hypothetical protein [Opitutales bacterium]
MKQISKTVVSRLGALILDAEAGARAKKARNRIYIHSKLFLPKQRTSAPKSIA